MFILCGLLFSGISLATSEKITYISEERPVVTYVNHKYAPFANVSCSRFHRQNVIYYCSSSFTTLCGFGDNVTMEIYFYELLSNVYKPSFIQIRKKLCDMLDNDKFVGTPIKAALGGSCPYPAGTYHVSNVTFTPTSIPRGFPFEKGRIYLNVTLTSTRELIASGHLDMELKEMTVKTKKKD